jgi:hypothetical protein
MKRSFTAPLALVAFVAALVASPQAQDRIQLARTAKVGDVSRYGMTGTMTLDNNGQVMTLEIRQTEKVTVTAIAANGDLTFESETEAADMSMNGQTMPSPNVGMKSTLVTKPDGSLVSYTMPETATGGSSLGKRMHNATAPLYPDKPIGVGDTWTREVKADAANSLPAATVTCEVLAFEKAEGVDTVKVKMTYQENDPGTPLKTIGTYWVERATGDQVKSEVTVQNLPMGQSGMVGTILVRQARLAGGR